MSYEYLVDASIDIICKTIQDIIQTHNKELIEDFFKKTSWFTKEKFCCVMKDAFISQLTNNNIDIYDVVCSINSEFEIINISAIILKELFEMEKLNLLIEAIPFSPKSILLETINGPEAEFKLRNTVRKNYIK